MSTRPSKQFGSDVLMLWDAKRHWYDQFVCCDTMIEITTPRPKYSQLGFPLI